MRVPMKGFLQCEVCAGGISEVICLRLQTRSRRCLSLSPRRPVFSWIRMLFKLQSGLSCFEGGNEINTNFGFSLLQRTFQPQLLSL